MQCISNTTFISNILRIYLSLFEYLELVYKVLPSILKELDRKLAGVSVETYFRFVMSQVLRICQRFSVFSIFCYIFANSNIKAQIGLLMPKLVCFKNMPMLRQSISGKCFSSLFSNFYVCSYGNGAPKTTVDLTEIWDLYASFSV